MVFERCTGNLTACRPQQATKAYICLMSTSIHDDTDSILANLPPESTESLLSDIRAEFLRSGKTLVVLDDDPTGTQTCYDVQVLTAWSVPLIERELRKHPSILFILTNSRSLPEPLAVGLAQEIGQNLLQAREKSGRDIAVISRSDSTLRGHFPAEVDAIADTLKIGDAVRVLVPAFIEGSRFTIGDVHYIREQGKLVPVSETPFAKDTVFGYKHANLREWVEEKTSGRVKASDVVSVSLEDIRLRGPEGVTAALSRCKPGGVCIVNACSHRDLEVLVMGLLRAEKSGQSFIYRTSATFVPIRAGIAAGKIFTPPQPHPASRAGSLVVVGSYVPKTTRQLEHLLAGQQLTSIELDVDRIMHPEENDSYGVAIARQANQMLSAGKDVVLHTSRRLVTGENAESSLQIHRSVSSFIVGIVQRLEVRPSFIIAKGGITSSDVATEGLRAERALILGQIIPGVPAWQLEDESRFPGIIYVVFPGNVGDDGALAEVFGKLKGVRV